MVVVGAMGGWPPADFGKEMIASFQKSMTFATFSADTVSAPDQRAALADLFAAADRGEVKAVVHEVLPLAQAAEAHQKMEAGEVFGRIALTHD
ncbi:zinc-binding dehydrogenase [Nocardia tenerifensis]|nr:zinc-binding dehydrogenase [Nocardia tenerifensis]